MFFMLNAGRALLLPGGGGADGGDGGRDDQTVAGLLLTGRRQVRLVRGHRARRRENRGTRNHRREIRLSILPSNRRAGRPTITTPEWTCKTIPKARRHEADD